MTIPYGAPIPYGSADYSYDGTAMTLQLGADVSTYQGAIGWAQVAGSAWGDFALCRMSIGRTTRDDRGRANLAGMLGAGIPVPGAYGVVGYAEPVEDGADLLLAEIAAAGADPARILVMLDAEDFGDGRHPTIDQVDRYAKRLFARLGRWPVAYVPDWWLDGHGYTVAGRALSNCPWAPSEYFPAPWTEARLLARKPTSLHGFKRLGWLQFTSSATVPGISGRVDLNCFFGTLQELRAQLLGQQEDIVGQLDGFPADTNYRDFFIELKDQGVRLNDHGDQAVGGSSNNHKAIMAKLTSIAAGVGALSDDEANILGALQGSEGRLLQALAGLQLGDPAAVQTLVEEIRKQPAETVAAIKEAL